MMLSKSTGSINDNTYLNEKLWYNLLALSNHKNISIASRNSVAGQTSYYTRLEWMVCNFMFQKLQMVKNSFRLTEQI